MVHMRNGAQLIIVGIQREGTIQTDLSGFDRKAAPHKRKFGIFGRRLFYLEFEVVVEFGRQSGTLEFKTLVGGSVSGTTTINID
jgi:hypothetical protein